MRAFYKGLLSGDKKKLDFYAISKSDCELTQMAAYVAFYFPLDPDKMSEDEIIRYWSYLFFIKDNPLPLKTFAVMCEK